MKRNLPALLLALALTTSLFISTTTSATPVTLTISSNASKGTVTGSGINCGSDCSESIEEGTVITLTATPQPGWVLTQGVGCPSGFHSSAVTCTFTLNAGNGYASFLWALASYNVTAKIEGTGTGSVSGTGTYALGSTYTLVATPGAGSVFAGWQTSGNICRIGSKSGTSVNPSPTCTEEAGGSATLTAVAKFDKVSAPQSPSSNTQVNTPNATTPSTQNTTKPAAPSLEGATIDGTTINASEKVVVDNDKPLVLSGRTMPNGKVALFVFSEPKRYDITADSEGKWTYSVSGLPEGDHHAEIEVTDPATNLTSDRVKLLEFTVLASAANPALPDTTQNQKKASSGSLPFIIGGILVILAGAVTAGFIWWKRKHKATQVFNPFDHQDPSIK